jgi:hypothetical protein
MQYFFELGLRSMTMGEYEKKILGLLKYVGFIKDEKVKIWRLLSGLPYLPFTLTIRKDKYLYEQGKGREYLYKSWKYKNKEKYDQRRKAFETPLIRSR